MLIVLGFLLVLLLIVLPLLKSAKATLKAKELNNDLEALFSNYEMYLKIGNFENAQLMIEAARMKVLNFTPEINYSPSELVQVLPALRKFPYWESWR